MINDRVVKGTTINVQYIRHNEIIKDEPERFPIMIIRRYRANFIDNRNNIRWEDFSLIVGDL